MFKQFSSFIGEIQANLLGKMLNNMEKVCSA